MTHRRGETRPRSSLTLPSAEAAKAAPKLALLPSRSGRLPAVSTSRWTALTLVLTATLAVALLSGAPTAGASALVAATAQPLAAPSVAVIAACSSVAYGGRTYIMYRRGVSCGFARRWVRRLHYTKRGPRGWRCGTGSGYRTGGGCARGGRSFGWHPGD